MRACGCLVAVADRLEQHAVVRKRPSGKVWTVERLVPEPLEMAAELLQHLAEQRVAAGVVNGEVENKRTFVLKEELGTKPRFYYFFDE